MCARWWRYLYLKSKSLYLSFWHLNHLKNSSESSSMNPSRNSSKNHSNSFKNRFRISSKTFSTILPLIIPEILERILDGEVVPWLFIFKFAPVFILHETHLQTTRLSGIWDEFCRGSQFSPLSCFYMVIFSINTTLSYSLILHSKACAAKLPPSFVLRS